MPSRLIQGHDSFDTCSQFSDSATLHTLTRIGALQKEVYFSRSESSFNNLDTISYGNSSTCCCDADVKVSKTKNVAQKTENFQTKIKLLFTFVSFGKIDFLFISAFIFFPSHLFALVYSVSHKMKKFSHLNKQSVK